MVFWTSLGGKEWDQVQQGIRKSNGRSGNNHSHKTGVLNVFMNCQILQKQMATCSAGLRRSKWVVWSNGLP